MKSIVILSGFILLLHTTLINADKFEINKTKDVQFWKVEVSYISMRRAEKKNFFFHCDKTVFSLVIEMFSSSYLIKLKN